MTKNVRRDQFDKLAVDVRQKLEIACTAVRSTMGSPCLAEWLAAQVQHERKLCSKDLAAAGIVVPEIVEATDDAAEAWARVAELEAQLQRIAGLSITDALVGPAIAAAVLKGPGDQPALAGAA